MSVRRFTVALDTGLNRVTKSASVVLASDYDALAAELADAKRELVIAGGPVLLANKMLVERDAASIARIATLEKALRDIKFNAGNKTGYGLIWQIAELALGSEQETSVQPSPDGTQMGVWRQGYPSLDDPPETEAKDG